MKKKKLLVILVYVSFLIGLFEGGARLSLSMPAFFNYIEEYRDSTKWRLDWVRRHKRGMEIVYKFDIYDSTKGWMSNPNIRNMKVFHNKVLNTNSKGVRGNVEYTYGKHPDKKRILILGDSLTFGEEVSDNETYPYYLQTMMSAAEIINMGVHGYGHDQMLILLKEEGIKYKPDVVVLGFVYWDMDRNVLQFRDYAKPMFVLHNGDLMLTGSPVPRPEDLLGWDWARPRIFDLLSLLKIKLKIRSGVYEKQKKELTEHLLDEMVVTIENVNAIPVFVYLPDRSETINKDTLTVGERFFFFYCQENKKVKCISSRPAFVNKIKEGERFKAEGHWGPLGNLTIAEVLYKNLID